MRLGSAGLQPPFLFVDTSCGTDDNITRFITHEAVLANLKDVARLAGVSVATASQALNGKYVNEKTREKVLQVAAELKYFPNRSGRTLITGKATAISLVIINATGHADIVHESTFFYHIIQGIIQVAEKRNHSFILDVRNWETDDLSAYFTRKVNDRSSDGLIIIPQFVRPYDFLDALGDFPVVFQNASNNRDKLNTVYVDHEAGAAMMAEHFIRRGYRDLAIIHGPEDHYDGLQRRRSFLQVMEDSGLKVPEDRQVYGDYTIESGYQGAAELLANRRPDAVFCANDYMAAGVMRFVKEQGMSIPADIAIAGYDNVELSTAVFPMLTTIDGRMFELGKALAENLFKVMDAGHSTLDVRLVPELLDRETV